jgi:hypothetical protein
MWRNLMRALTSDDVHAKSRPCAFTIRPEAGILLALGDQGFYEDVWTRNIQSSAVVAS